MLPLQTSHPLQYSNGSFIASKRVFLKQCSVLCRMEARRDGFSLPSSKLTERAGLPSLPALPLSCRKGRTSSLRSWWMTHRIPFTSNSHSKGFCCKQHPVFCFIEPLLKVSSLILGKPCVVISGLTYRGEHRGDDGLISRSVSGYCKRQVLAGDFLDGVGQRYTRSCSTF